MMQEFLLPMLAKHPGLGGFFFVDFAIFWLSSISTSLVNNVWGRRVTPSLSVSSFKMKSGLHDHASGAESCFPGM